ncbi:sarcosine oxidase subunit gamma [Aliiruegeria haliotis]|uniref:Sarcosine oxidase subunit gamma n=1 Tax=Aliiruegeria haliotis TaxID=1280846 RepID=A0A2T0RXY4_9RHOB|nr:sarcosine oxidase subunit gamma [Aliiruegeria haliotis]PRY26031.1 sarcosine oxidase subunit gamma [Aliiruegeria haliotis]
MTRLMMESPLSGLDLRIGEMRLEEVDLGAVHWLAPWPGESLAMGHALQAALAVHFPQPGEHIEQGHVRVLWAGREQAFLIGTAPPQELSQHGAVVDVTEGWAAMRLRGEAVAGALARLTPLDLRPDVFGVGQTARSLLGHITAQVTPIDGGFEIMVMRSFARSAAHEIEVAMRSVAARAEVAEGRGL